MKREEERIRKLFQQLREDHERNARLLLTIGTLPCRGWKKRHQSLVMEALSTTTARTGAFSIYRVTRTVLGKIPDSVTIGFHQNGYIYVMDRQGDNVTQITFGQTRQWEHAAVSHDRRYVLGNEILQAREVNIRLHPLSPWPALSLVLELT